MKFLEESCNENKMMSDADINSKLEKLEEQEVNEEIVELKGTH